MKITIADAVKPIITSKALRQKTDRALAREEAGQGILSIDAIKKEGFRKYCVMLSAFVQLLGAADELVWRVKTAVGETSYVDVEQPFLSRNER